MCAVPIMAVLLLLLLLVISTAMPGVAKNLDYGLRTKRLLGGLHQNTEMSV
jgi:hypothetical protein